MTCPHGWRDEIDCETCRPRRIAELEDGTRPTDRDSRAQDVALAMCNAEREHHMLSEILAWSDLTDEAQAHYMRLASAAMKAVGI